MRAYRRSGTGTLLMRRKRRSFRVRKRSSRTRSTRPSALAKAKIVRTINQLSETKRLAVLNEVVNPIGQPSTFSVCKNVTSALTSGVVSSNVIGRDISELILSFKWHYGYFMDDMISNFPDIPEWTTNVALIATNDQVAGSVTWVPTPSTWYIQQNPYRTVFDGNTVTVLKKKRTRKYAPPPMVTQTAGSTVTTTGWGGRTVMGSLKYKFKGKKKFEVQPDASQSSTEFLKGWNYYLVVQMAGLFNSIVSTYNTPLIQTDTYLYFKDL